MANREKGLPRREQTIVVKATAAEKLVVVKEAAAAGMNVSDYLRTAVLHMIEAGSNKTSEY